ncbi:hypothetical protein XNW1_1970024 [Xenorhabdus nematophila str. Websteri]|nr:hypothetical protein XNW1_1970024 [Xenorhabdus nematophila str. Websteri]
MNHSTKKRHDTRTLLNSTEPSTRYAKNSASFLAAVQIRCLALWLRIS